MRPFLLWVYIVVCGDYCARPGGVKKFFQTGYLLLRKLPALKKYFAWPDLLSLSHLLLKLTNRYLKTVRI